jgi:hypothetical protein
MRKNKTILILCTVIIILTQYSYGHDKLEKVWGLQLGTESHDVSRCVVADPSGNCYITGNTKGKLGDKNYGKHDAYVAKLDSSGKISWIRQMGSSEKDNAIEITFHNGHIYICGETFGKFGAKHAGGADIFFSKLDTKGNMLWTRQTGTSADDTAKSIVLDSSNNIYLTGHTQGCIGEKHHGETDAFINKYKNSGDLIRQTQIGTSAEDRGNGIAVDKTGNVYITGSTKGKLGKTHFGGSDMIIAKLDSKGNVSWIQQYGTPSNEWGTSIVVDKKGYVYAGGGTEGNLFGDQKGKGDSCVFRCDSSGSIIWGRQFGTELWDTAWGVVLCKDDSNDILVGGCQHYYPCQAFLRRFDDKGNPGFVYEIIKTGDKYGVCGKNISMDNFGYYYITGGTRADLFSKQKGGGDIFLAKYKMK